VAYFEGSLKDFTKFIGAYARIKVMHIAARYKKQVGKCEECSISSKSLEAAHVSGMERPLIISTILSQFLDGDMIKIDLNEFEERFVAAHLPIENTIRILCKECHRRYDNSKKVHELESVEKTYSNSEEKDSIEKEGQLIENLVTQKYMNKTKALTIGRTKSLASLNNANTIFSNVNSAQNVWWLEPNNTKFQTDLYFILNNEKDRTLYFLKLPAGTIKNPTSHFQQRNDNIKTNCSDIYIPISNIKFEDRKGYDFTRFLVKKVAY
jgi:hypothetical protein